MSQFLHTFLVIPTLNPPPYCTSFVARLLREYLLIMGLE
jgi:hypothetical protein